MVTFIDFNPARISEYLALPTDPVKAAAKKATIDRLQAEVTENNRYIASLGMEDRKKRLLSEFGETEDGKHTWLGVVRTLEEMRILGSLMRIGL